MYSLINEYLKTFNLPNEIYTDLILLNESVVAKQGNLINYEIKTKYNILEYILHTDSKLKKEDVVVNVTYPHDPIRSKDLGWFMESIFFARRRSFGKNFLRKK